MDKHLPEWKPTAGYIQGGRMRGRVYTIRKPTFHVKDEQGRIIGAIQTFKNGDDAIYQFGNRKPDFAVGYGASNLTNYGKGIGLDSSQRQREALASYLHYCLGPKSALPELAVQALLFIVPVEGGAA